MLVLELVLRTSLSVSIHNTVARRFSFGVPSSRSGFNLCCPAALHNLLKSLICVLSHFLDFFFLDFLFLFFDVEEAEEEEDEDEVSESEVNELSSSCSCFCCSMWDVVLLLVVKVVEYPKRSG